MKSRPLTGAEVRRLRLLTGLSQDAFWGLVGVDQAHGSRLERGVNKISRPMEIAVMFVYSNYGFEPGIEKMIARWRKEVRYAL